MGDHRTRIFEIERQIMKLKTRHALGMIPYRQAKHQLVQHHAELRAVLDALPPEQRELYFFKKELQVL